jgi:polyisoprenoid-binding protein YceI
MSAPHPQPNMAANGASSQPTWVFDNSHCRIGFSVNHFGISDTEGRFREFEGSVTSAKGDFSDLQINLKALANSIDTEDPNRDQHLRSADFFDSSNHPYLVFTSTNYSHVGGNQYELHGHLEMRGHRQAIILDVTYNGMLEKDPFGNTVAGFTVRGALNRKDWGITWNRFLDAGGLAVGERVRINCNIELIRK